jgi:hypothetical protein
VLIFINYSIILLQFLNVAVLSPCWRAYTAYSECSCMHRILVGVIHGNFVAILRTSF